MMLNPLAPTFSPTTNTRPYSLGRPTRDQGLEILESTPTATSSAKTPPPVACSSQLEEQIQSLNTQMNQLKTFSESSLQQTTPLIQKFPLAHLKQVQYLHSVQLTVVQLHQDLESEKFERQTLQLLVCQLQKDILLLQTFCANQNTRAPPEPFTIDPPSEGTIAKLSNLETHELLNTPTPEPVLIENSDPHIPSALPSSSAQRPLSPEPTFTVPIKVRIDQLEKLLNEEVSRTKSLLSGLRSNYSFLYDKIRQLEAGSSNTIFWRICSVNFVYCSAKSTHRASKSIDDKSSGYWSPIFRSHPYGYNFIIRFYPYGLGTNAGQFVTILFAFFPGDYDNLLRWPFPKINHLGLRDQLDPLNTWTQKIQPTQEHPFRRPTSSPKNDAFLIALHRFIPHSKFFNETEGSIVNDTCYLEISLSDPSPQNSTAQAPVPHPFS